MTRESAGSNPGGIAGNRQTVRLPRKRGASEAATENQGCTPPIRRGVATAGVRDVREGGTSIALDSQRVYEPRCNRQQKKKTPVLRKRNWRGKRCNLNLYRRIWPCRKNCLQRDPACAGGCDGQDDSQKHHFHAGTSCRRPTRQFARAAEPAEG